MRAERQQGASAEPRIDAGPSNYEFDQFDKSVVDYWICNDALFNGMSKVRAREDLEMKVESLLLGHSMKVRAKRAHPL